MGSEMPLRFSLQQGRLTITIGVDTLALAAIPLEALRATECDPGGKLCDEVKAGIVAATDAIRSALDAGEAGSVTQGERDAIWDAMVNGEYCTGSDRRMLADMVKRGAFAEKRTEAGPSREALMELPEVVADFVPGFVNALDKLEYTQRLAVAYGEEKRARRKAETELERLRNLKGHARESEQRAEATPPAAGEPGKETT